MSTEKMALDGERISKIALLMKRWCPGDGFVLTSVSIADVVEAIMYNRFMRIEYVLLDTSTGVLKQKNEDGSVGVEMSFCVESRSFYAVRELQFELPCGSGVFSFIATYRQTSEWEGDCDSTTNSGEVSFRFTADSAGDVTYVKL